MQRIIFRSLFFTFLLTAVAACKKDPQPEPEPEPNDSEYGLGWFGDDDMDHIQTNIGFGNFGNGQLPASVDLTTKFPPIGDQGQYGTCVAWAVAYNYKTAIQGMDKGYTASQLSSPSYQFSPRDLFTAIPDNEKGNNCNGTNFAYALNVLQNRGVATLATVPYTNLGDCSQSNLNPAWANEASEHKIEYWRKLEAQSADDVKRVLANNIPVIFGAKLADNFMSWNSDAVISSHTSFYNVGQHAYHAMVVAGYDDNKGPNGAFKVINSWGNTWGSQGYIWIDYNFFLNEFAKIDGERCLFTAVNKGGNINPPTDPDPVATGVDLAAWVFDDYSTGQVLDGRPVRASNFNIYNIGNQQASASTSWSAYYIAFNAYNANDYHVLYNVDFNTSIAQNTYECPNFNSCIFNIDVPSGNDFANVAFGNSWLNFEYTVPNITGEYYLVLFVDGTDAFGETDETNNLFYPSFDPIEFDGGWGLQGGTDDRSNQAAMPFNFKNSTQPVQPIVRSNEHNIIVTAQQPNAYRMEELKALLKNAKKDGTLAKKVQEMRARNQR